VACTGGRTRSGCRAAGNPVVRTTGGNFGLIERLITQVGRLMDINGFDDISPDLITAARQTLVIGTQ
jgi:hypothetical protein